MVRAGLCEYLPGIAKDTIAVTISDTGWDFNKRIAQLYLAYYCGLLLTSKDIS